MGFCKSRNFPRFLKWALIGLMIVILGLLLTLPWSITWLTDRTPNDPEGMYIKYLVTMGVSGVMAELVLWQVLGIIRNVINGRVFSDDTVRRIRVVAFEFLALGVFYGGALLWVHKFFMALLFVTLVLACCFVLVMAEVFHQANQFKEENDMTI